MYYMDTLTKDSIIIKVDPTLKESFKLFSARYGGMTSVLLHFVNGFVDAEVQKSQQRAEQLERQT